MKKHLKKFLQECLIMEEINDFGCDVVKGMSMMKYNMYHDAKELFSDLLDKTENVETYDKIRECILILNDLPTTKKKRQLIENLLFILRHTFLPSE